MIGYLEMLISIPEEINVLLVDAEESYKDSLTREMASAEVMWRISGVCGDDEALRHLAEKPVDILISDLNQFHISGASFLDEVKEQYPSIIRFAHSHQEKAEEVLKASGAIHRYLDRPAKAEKIVDSIKEVFLTRERVQNEWIRMQISQVDDLQVPSKATQELLDTLNDPECELEDVSIYLEANPTLSANVLRIANSAHFGHASTVETIEEALAVLGLGIVGDMALLQLAREQIDVPKEYQFLSDSIMDHSVEVGMAVRKLARQIKGSAIFCNTATTAAFLHDIGKLVLLSGNEKDYLGLMQRTLKTGRCMWVIENEEYNCCHSFVGAYLFELWGLPKEVVETVAFHHEPAKSRNKEISALTLLHIADAQVHEQNNGAQKYLPGPVDERYLENLGLSRKDFLDESSSGFPMESSNKATDKGEDDSVELF